MTTYVNHRSKAETNEAAANRFSLICQSTFNPHQTEREFSKSFSASFVNPLANDFTVETNLRSSNAIYDDCNCKFVFSMLHIY